ncbi:uncharacterized protein LOC128954399 [Oppia nitens]|uniref:uncharacterized protein LOC128954399 n=1 Tax=Oppia nitens TaxID=1686743 RepID=UPI0023DA1905|nr:uncharacterized protein LOC128954399 [Oppia nitens]
MTTTTTTAKKDSFDRFGDDLAELLLQYLPIKDRLILQSVSKQWLALIFTTQTDLIFGKKLNNMSLNSIDLNYYETIIKWFEVIVSKCPNITAVNINVSIKFPGSVHIMNQIMNLLIKYCHQLLHISIELHYRGLWSDFDSMFESLFTKFGRQLLTFKFDGNNLRFNKQLFYDVVNGVTNLKTLDIIYRGRLFGSGRKSSVQLNDIFRDNNKFYSLPKSLQSLNIKLDDTSLPLFANFADIYGHQLISLTLLIDESVVDEDKEWAVNLKPLSTGFRQMPRLRQLMFDLPINFSLEFIGDLFTTIGRNCRQLKSLHYECRSYYSNISIINPMFDAIDEHMSRQLRRLSVDCSAVYDNDLLLTSGSLNRLHALTHLILRSNVSSIIGDQFFRDIHRNLPRLQYIKCDRMSITDESIAAMGQLAHLRDVYLPTYGYIEKTSEANIRRHLLIDTKVKHLFLVYKDSIDGIQQVFKCGKYVDNDNQISSNSFIGSLIASDSD